MAAKSFSKTVPNFEENLSRPRVSNEELDVGQKRMRMDMEYFPFEESQSVKKGNKKLSNGDELSRGTTVAGLVTDTSNVKTIVADKSVYVGGVGDKGKGKASDSATVSGVEAPNDHEYIVISYDSERLYTPFMRNS
ncbi:hypothetical protein RYX36_034311 [Vicia faba]